MDDYDHHFNPPNQTHGPFINPPRTDRGERIHPREPHIEFPQKQRI
jgi:hypothetical protein